MDNLMLKQRIEQWQSGDRSAFDDIYKELKTPIYTIIYRILYDRTLSEDVMQDTFIRLLKAPSSLPIKNPRAWIFQVARNLAIDCKRRRKVEEELSDDTVSTEPSLEEGVCTRLDMELALSHLPIQEREVVTLHVNAGLRFREISELTNQPLGTVLWRYRKAIGTLRFMGGV